MESYARVIADGCLKSDELPGRQTPTPGVLFVLKTPFFTKKIQKKGDFGLLEELIFAKIGKMIKSVQKMFDLKGFLY